MATTRTYTVGLNGEVWRMLNHDPNTWTDVSLSSLINTTNYLQPTSGGEYNIFTKLTGYNLVDVMSDPEDSSKLCVISGNNPSILPSITSGPGEGGIFVSHDAGATWFMPQGDWLDVCDTNSGKVSFHFEVWYADSNTIYVISQGGYIFRSLDGGLTFNSIKDNTGTNVQAGAGNIFTSCIHMWKDTTGINGGLDYGVIAQQEDLTQPTSDVKVWKTLDGGVTWSQLNSNNPIKNTILSTDLVGNATGIYISQDQSMITVQCEYVTNRSLDSGATFITTLETLRNGLHLTWFEPYDPFVADFWVTQKGLATNSITNSIDGAATWATTLSNGSRTDGAHFYTSTNGYITSGTNLLSTTQSGTNPQPSLSIVGDNSLLAVWTGSELQYYILSDCTDTSSKIIVIDDPNGSILEPYVAPINGASIQITNSPNIDPTKCWTVDYYDGTNTPPNVEVINAANTIIVYDSCQQCLPPPPTTECWKLELCPFSTGITCQTVENHTGFDWTAWENQYIYINGDTTCIYRPLKIMQAVFVTPDSYSTLCALPTPWANSIEYLISSLVYNGTQYISGTSPSYVMTDLNYDPVECAALVCSSVACGTTENSYSNVPDFINNTLVTLGLDNVLDAYPNDTSNTPSILFSDSSFKMQYTNGDTFSITIIKIVGGITTYYNYSIGAGNSNNVSIGSSPGATKDIAYASQTGSSLCSDTTTLPVVDVTIPIVDATCEKIDCLIDATAVFTNPTVNGGSDGSITLTITGAQNPTFILWSTGATNVQSLTGLSAGVYSVTIIDTGIENCQVQLQIILTEPPPAPPEPETCEVTPRLGEPGFSVKNCDPKTVIKIKNQFSDSVYAWFKRLRYGIETCCEFDLDKIDIKNQLLELGEMNDPDACVRQCNSYLVTASEVGTATFTYKDCFGATITDTVEQGPVPITLTTCAQPDTFASLDNPINVEFIEKCCDPIQNIPMISYCISLTGTDITAVISWIDYEGVTKNKTLTNVQGSCGPEGVDTLYICAQEDTVSSSVPTETTITQKGTC